LQVVVDRQGLVAKIFGGSMLFIAGCFLYWPGSALVEYFLSGALRDVPADEHRMEVASWKTGDRVSTQGDSWLVS